MTSNFANKSALEVKTKDGVRFGKELREKEFLFDGGYVPLNHGMFSGFSSLLVYSVYTYGWSPLLSMSSHLPRVYFIFSHSLIFLSSKLPGFLINLRQLIVVVVSFVAHTVSPTLII
jgi:hypothetical protein